MTGGANSCPRDYASSGIASITAQAKSDRNSLGVLTTATSGPSSDSLSARAQAIWTDSVSLTQPQLAGLRAYSIGSDVGAGEPLYVQTWSVTTHIGQFAGHSSLSVTLDYAGQEQTAVLARSDNLNGTLSWDIITDKGQRFADLDKLSFTFDAPFDPFSTDLPPTVSLTVDASASANLQGLSVEETSTVKALDTFALSTLTFSDANGNPIDALCVQSASGVSYCPQDQGNSPNPPSGNPPPTSAPEPGSAVLLLTLLATGAGFAAMREARLRAEPKTGAA